MVRSDGSPLNQKLGWKVFIFITVVDERLLPKLLHWLCYTQKLLRLFQTRKDARNIQEIIPLFSQSIYNCFSESFCVYFKIYQIVNTLMVTYYQMTWLKMRNTTSVWQLFIWGRLTYFWEVCLSQFACLWLILHVWPNRKKE